MDVARKVTILARVAGNDHLELSSLHVDSLVPQELRNIESADEFLKELPKFDSEFARKSAEASQKGEVLRYVGVVDLEGHSNSVKLVRYVNESLLQRIKKRAMTCNLTSLYIGLAIHLPILLLGLRDLTTLWHLPLSGFLILL